MAKRISYKKIVEYLLEQSYYLHIHNSKKDEKEEEKHKYTEGILEEWLRLTKQDMEER